MFQKKYPFQYYLVGGFVRDKLLGRPSKDTDFVVVGSTPNELLKLGFIQVGKSFPVFLEPNSNDEYALARKEKKIALGHQGFEFDFNPNITLEDDLYRRDFTINAMSLDLQGKLIDPFGGEKDLKNKIIRHVSPHFIEDPLRVFRAAKFCARLDFSIAPETLNLMKQIVNSGEIKKLSIERIKVEFEDAMRSEHFDKFVDVLQKINLWNEYAVDFPVANSLKGLHQINHFWAINGAFANQHQMSKINTWVSRYKLSNSVVGLTKALILFLNWNDSDQQNIDSTLNILSHFQDGKDKIAIAEFCTVLDSLQKVQDVTSKRQLLEKLFEHFRRLDLSSANSYKEVWQKRQVHLREFFLNS